MQEDRNNTQNTHDRYLQLNCQSDRSRNADFIKSHTTLNEDSMSVKYHHLLYSCNVRLLNMDELNLHKRAAGEIFPSASSCSVSITGQEQLNY